MNNILIMSSDEKNNKYIELCINYNIKKRIQKFYLKSRSPSHCRSPVRNIIINDIRRRCPPPPPSPENSSSYENIISQNNEY
jgi:hypothetical protein